MSNFARRRQKVRAWLAANGAEALLVTSPHSVRYLFGFGGEGLAVVGAHSVLCTDRRYELEARALPGRVSVELHPDGHLAGAMARLCATGDIRLGFEAEVTTYAAFQSLQEKLPGVALIPTKQVVEQLRQVKDADELATIGRAAAIMDQALSETLRRLKAGRTEREVALDVERAALLAGGQKIAFDTIAAFGPSAAFPHAVPGDRRLERGQVVKIDCGAYVDGYCADITRTVVFGRADEQTRRVYNAVYDAQQAAVAAARAGVKAADLDTVARDIITERGFGPHFGHGLGHGVGLQVHELPRVSARSEDVLRAGMVITIEPGIYLEGWGGVRIEDTVAITRTGCEVLTRTEKQRLR